MQLIFFKFVQFHHCSLWSFSQVERNEMKSKSVSVEDRDFGMEERRAKLWRKTKCMNAVVDPPLVSSQLLYISYIFLCLSYFWFCKKNHGWRIKRRRRKRRRRQEQKAGKMRIRNEDVLLEKWMKKSRKRHKYIKKIKARELLFCSSSSFIVVRKVLGIFAAKKVCKTASSCIFLLWEVFSSWVISWDWLQIQLRFRYELSTLLASYFCDVFSSFPFTFLGILHCVCIFLESKTPFVSQTHTLTSPTRIRRHEKWRWCWRCWRSRDTETGMTIKLENWKEKLTWFKVLHTKRKKNEDLEIERSFCSSSCLSLYRSFLKNHRSIVDFMFHSDFSSLVL